MLKKTITYENYDGKTCTEDFYFHMNRAELIKFDSEFEGGMIGVLKRVMNGDTRQLIEFIETLIMRAYGEKSSDGKRFIKSKEAAEAFKQSPAYDELFMSILSDTDSQTAFISGIIPQGIAKDAAAISNDDVAKMLEENGVYGGLTSAT